MDNTLSRALALTALALPTILCVAQAPAQVPAGTLVVPLKQEKTAPSLVPSQQGKTPVPKKQTTTTTPAASGKTATPRKATRAVPPTPAKPVWQEFKLDPKATLFLDFTESSADAVLSIFSRTSGITILRDPNFRSPLTVTSAKAVPLNEAFEILNTVLGLQGYSLQKRGNLLLVARIPQPPQQSFSAPPPPPQPEIKTYVLQNANATAVAKVLTDILGSAASGGNNGGGAPQFPGGIVFNGAPMQAGGGGGGAGALKITSEDYTNSVIVKALPAEQAKAKAIIDELDKKTAAPALESEVFTLTYIPIDQAVSAIDDVLTVNAPTGRGAKKASNNQNQNYYSYYDRYNTQSQKSAGEQSVTAIKQTNSMIVNATKENMALVRKIVTSLDRESPFVGTTNIIRLENAKASDVADLLTKLFTTPRSNNNDGGFFITSDFFGGGSNNQKSPYNLDTDETGKIVNVREVAGKVTVVADPNTNSIVIQTQPGNMRMIRPIVQKLDSPVTQVMIETVIVEANLTQTDKLGVEYGTLGSVLNGGDTGSGSIDFGIASSTTLQGLKYTIGNPDYKIFLNAVSSDDRFKVLDTPRIFTSNNAQAIVNVGQQYPYAGNTNVTALGTIVGGTAFADIGVKLTVTPRITANDQVTMDVEQTASDLQGFSTLGPNLQAPIINNRSAKTTVSVRDGATIVLGGIIRHTTTDSKTKVPLLGDLPFLGVLFRSTQKTKGQTELLVFLTPHVVRSLADADRLRKSQTGELTKPSQDDLKKIVPPVGTGGTP